MGTMSKKFGPSAGGQDSVCYNTANRRPSTRQLHHIGAPLDALESSLDGDNRSVLRCLRLRALSQSLPVYLVGGPVRDVLVGMPIKDLDFTIEGEGPEVARWLAGELGGEVLTHPRFGTATLVMGSSRVDVVTARREIYPQPAELPKVFPGTISDDLARRDFSINAMAIPLSEHRPEVLDPHGGIEDLRKGLIRVLHPNSFVDDPTRILRAVRYEQRLGYRIEDETLSLLHDAVMQGHLASLTGDRLRHELERVLTEERPELALKRAVALELLAVVHPRLGDGDTVERLEALTSATPAHEICSAGAGPLAFIAALAYPLSREEGEAMVHRLNMSSAWAQAVRHTVLLREREEELAIANLKGSQLVDLVHEFCDEAVLAVSRLTTSPLVAQRLTDYLKELRFVVTNLNGRDLLAMGMPAGPEVGRALQELREAKLDGSVSSEADERRLVQRILTRERGP